MADRRSLLDRHAPDRAGDGEIRAAIDLGTNSFHLVVARVEPDGHFDVLDREKEVVRLGSGAGVMRNLTPAAIERGIETLGRFRRIADGFGATIDAVATSALARRSTGTSSCDGRGTRSASTSTSCRASKRRV